CARQRVAHGVELHGDAAEQHAPPDVGHYASSAVERHPGGIAAEWSTPPTEHGGDESIDHGGWIDSAATEVAAASAGRGREAEGGGLSPSRDPSAPPRASGSGNHRREE